MKRVWNLCLLLLVVGLGSSCKDDLPGLGKDANRYFSGDDLVLTYSGEPMVGKEVHFLTYDGEKATITLDGLLDSNTLSRPRNCMILPLVLRAWFRVKSRRLCRMSL